MSIHNRARMIAAPLLTKNLGIPWQEGARWFRDTLIDAGVCPGKEYPLPLIDLKISRKKALDTRDHVKRQSD